MKLCIHVYDISVYYCYVTADILTKLLQQCFLFFIFVVIPCQFYYSQVSVYRTIGPLALIFYFFTFDIEFSFSYLIDTLAPKYFIIP